MITRANYEQFFLDFHEAALDAASEKELYVFLDQNPDLREEFESFVDLKIESDPQITFTNKERLHRTKVTQHNYLSCLVGYMENDLDDADRKSVELFIAGNPGVAEELEILRKTKIVPDRTVTFSAKDSLKREARVIGFSPSFYRVTAIAASLIILLLSYFVLVDSKQDPVLAEKPAVEKSLKPATEVEVPVTPDNSIPVNSTETDRNPVKTAGQKFAERKVNSVGHKKTKTVNSASQVQEMLTPSVVEIIAEPQTLIVSIEDKPEPSLILNEMYAANNSVTALNFDMPPKDLSTVFTQEELAEFGLVPKPSEPNNKITAWDLVESGVDRLGKVTGTKIEIDRHTDHIENATTYALGIGRFSVSRTRTNY